MYIFKKTIAVIAGIFLVNVALAKTAPLTIKKGARILYQCENKVNAVATYYGLSDNSLSFVKVTTKGKTFTLPQAVSASGSRYSDNLTMEWWEHQGNAMMSDLTTTTDKSKTTACNPIKKYL